MLNKMVTTVNKIKQARDSARSKVFELAKTGTRLAAETILYALACVSGEALFFLVAPPVLYYGIYNQASRIPLRPAYDFLVHKLESNRMSTGIALTVAAGLVNLPLSFAVGTAVATYEGLRIVAPKVKSQFSILTAKLDNSTRSLGISEKFQSVINIANAITMKLPHASTILTIARGTIEASVIAATWFYYPAFTLALTTVIALNESNIWDKNTEKHIATHNSEQSNNKSASSSLAKNITSANIVEIGAITLTAAIAPLSSLLPFVIGGTVAYETVTRASLRHYAQAAAITACAMVYPPTLLLTVPSAVIYEGINLAKNCYRFFTDKQPQTANPTGPQDILTDHKHAPMSGPNPAPNFVKMISRKRLNNLEKTA
jgi:hypothetical protein